MTKELPNISFSIFSAFLLITPIFSAFLQSIDPGFRIGSWGATRRRRGPGVSLPSSTPPATSWWGTSSPGSRRSTTWRRVWWRPRRCRTWATSGPRWCQTTSYFIWEDKSELIKILWMFVVIGLNLVCAKVQHSYLSPENCEWDKLAASHNIVLTKIFQRIWRSVLTSETTSESTWGRGLNLIAR